MGLGGQRPRGGYGSTLFACTGSVIVLYSAVYVKYRKAVVLIHVVRGPGEAPLEGRSVSSGWRWRRGR